MNTPSAKAKKDRSEGSAVPLELVRLSRKGDGAAMEALYEHLKGPLFGLAYRYTYNAAASEDILQDVFVKIFTHIHDIDRDEAFLGWAYRVAINTCLSYLRRRKTMTRKMVPFEIAEGLSRGADSPDHEDMFEKNLDEALFGLSSKLKSVFILHDIQGFKHEEIAQIMGCSIGTSKSQLFKARIKIRQHLRKKQVI